MTFKVRPSFRPFVIGVILYLNLPYNTIVKDRLKPIKIFPKGGVSEFTIKHMLEAFEK